MLECRNKPLNWNLNQKGAFFNYTELLLRSLLLPTMSYEDDIINNFASATNWQLRARSGANNTLIRDDSVQPSRGLVRSNFRRNSDFEFVLPRDRKVVGSTPARRISVFRLFQNSRKNRRIVGCQLATPSLSPNF